MHGELSLYVDIICLYSPLSLSLSLLNYVRSSAKTLESLALINNLFIFSIQSGAEEEEMALLNWFNPTLSPADWTSDWRTGLLFLYNSTALITSLLAWLGELD